MIIHSKVLGRDFSCDAKDAAETMKAVLALEAAAKAEDDNKDDDLASELDNVQMELDESYEEQDKLETELDELEAKIEEVESKLYEVYDRIDELEAKEAELEDLMDEDDDSCEWDCDCDDCPDKEACCDEDDEDEDKDESPYHCAAVIISNGNEEKRVPADFSAVIDAILEMLEDEEDDLDC